MTMDFGRASLGNLLVGCAILAVTAMAPDVSSAQTRDELRQVTQELGASGTFAAAERQTIEVLLPDGTSIILSPGASATLSSDAGTGQVSIALTEGLIRVAGGTANAKVPILITTPQVRLTLEAGAAIVAVGDGRTRAHLLNGVGLSVACGGGERLLYRPGFQVVADGTSCTRPTKMAADSIASDLLRLSGGLESGVPPTTSSRQDRDREREIVAVSELTVEAEIAIEFQDDDVKGDGSFGGIGGNGETGGSGGTGGTGGTGGGGSGGNGGNGTVDFDAGFGPIDLAGSFEETTGNSVDNIGEGNTTLSFGEFSVRLQDAASDRRGDGEEIEEARLLGPTTNRIMTNESLSQTAPNPPQSFYAPNSQVGLSYFSGTSTIGLRDSSIPHPDFDEEGLFLFGTAKPAFGPGLVVHDQNGVVQTLSHQEAFFVSTIRQDFGGSDFEYVSDSAWGLYQFPNPQLAVGRGAYGYGLNFGEAVCYGPCTQPRAEDTFFLLELTPADSIAIVCSTSDCAGEIAQEMATRGAGAYYYAFGDSLGGSTADGSATALIVDPAIKERMVFASGDLDGAATSLPPGASNDIFHLSAGMQGAILNGITGLAAGMDTSAGGRAFMRAETWTDLDHRTSGAFALATSDLTDSGLYVVNPGVGPGVTTQVGTNPALLHVDFGLMTAGAGSATRQVSSISVTIGQVAFRLGTDLDGSPMVDGIVTARTIGSSRGLNHLGESEASTLITSDLRSTSAGGSNPNLDADGDGVADPGRLGFFVLENAGLIFDDNPNTPQNWTLPGGTERPLGNGSIAPADQSFALLRLGVATGSNPAPARSLPGSYAGYATALVEVEQGAAKPTLARLSSPAGGANLDLNSFDGAAGRFAADLYLSGGTLRFGDHIGTTGGLSAFATDDLYAARTDPASGADMAIVSGNLISKGLEGKFKKSDGSGVPAPDSYKYEHVKWGAFFGDVLGKDGARQHVHLGSYAAGKKYTHDINRKLSDVEIEYRGHALGNVSSGKQVYTSLGTYKDRFSFKTRTGSVEMDFDGRKYQGGSTSPADLSSYTGSVTAGDRTGGLKGHFIGDAVDKGKGLAPAGVVGRFDITDTSSAPGSYRATGTFGAEQGP